MSRLASWRAKVRSPGATRPGERWTRRQRSVVLFGCSDGQVYCLRASEPSRAPIFLPALADLFDYV
jgi:hypothetical protein